jgi:ankyrin repeat protein
MRTPPAPLMAAACVEYLRSCDLTQHRSFAYVQPDPVANAAPLHHACELGDLDLMALHLRSGANPNAIAARRKSETLQRRDGRVVSVALVEGTALMFAIFPRSYDCARALIGVTDLSIANAQGETALILAAKQRSFDIIRELLPGSDATARDWSGRCAMDWLVAAAPTLWADDFRKCGHVADLLAEHSPRDATEAAFSRFGALSMPRYNSWREAQALRDEVEAASAKKPPLDDASRRVRRL